MVLEFLDSELPERTAFVQLVGMERCPSKEEGSSKHSSPERSH